MATPAPAARPGLRPYLVVAAALGTGLGVHSAQRYWSDDVWIHAAAILEHAARPWVPGHPQVAAEVGDPALNPYTWWWGRIIAATGADVLDVLVVAALVNLVALGWAWWRLARRLAPTGVAPAVSLVAVVALWGVGSWRWSGFPGLNSLGFGLPYPSAAATALALVAVERALVHVDRPRWSTGTMVMACWGGVLLFHPYTAAASALSLAGLVAWRSWRGGPSVPLLGPLVVGGALAVSAFVAWPHVDALALVSGGGDYDNGRLLVRFPARAALGLATVLAVGVATVRWRDERYAALVALPLAAAIGGWLIGEGSLVRALPLALVPGFLATGELVGRAVAADRTRSPAVLAVAAACLVGLLGSTSGLSRMVPTAVSPSWLRDRMEASADEERAGLPEGLARGVVVAVEPSEPRTALFVLGTGAKLVAPPRPAPELDDVDLRWAANAAAVAGDPGPAVDDFGATHRLVRRDGALSLEALTDDDR